MAQRSQICSSLRETPLRPGAFFEPVIYCIIPAAHLRNLIGENLQVKPTHLKSLLPLHKHRVNHGQMQGPTIRVRDFSCAICSILQQQIQLHQTPSWCIALSFVHSAFFLFLLCTPFNAIELLFINKYLGHVTIKKQEESEKKKMPSLSPFAAVNYRSEVGLPPNCIWLRGPYALY